MIFKKNININIDENIIKRKQVPILIKDKQWKKIISDNKNRTIKSLSLELEELIDEEKSLKREWTKHNQEKRRLMNKILQLSDLVNTKGQEDMLPELERCKEEINKVNQNIDKIMENLESYPSQIEKLNFNLLKETIKIVYQDMICSNDELFLVAEKMNKLRQELGELRDERIFLEERVEELYSFLHDTVGHEEMEKLDIKFLEDEETGGHSID